MTALPAYHQGRVVFRDDNGVAAIDVRYLGRVAAHAEMGHGPFNIDGRWFTARTLLEARAAFEDGLPEIADCICVPDCTEPGTEANGWCEAHSSGAAAMGFDEPVDWEAS